MHQLSIAVSLLTLLHLIPRGSGNTAEERDCRVDAFPTQSDFNADMYQGHWYVVSISRYWFEIPFLSDRFPPTDLQAMYTFNKDGTINIQSTGSGFLGFGCSSTNGTAVAPNKEFPQKAEVSFSGTLLGWLIGTKPYWILRTDYTGFAVIYACWKKAGDGTCRPRQTFLWTINRDPKGHTPEQMATVNAVVRDACIDPSKLKIIEQTGKCGIKDDTPPKDEM